MTWPASRGWQSLVLTGLLLCACAVAPGATSQQVQKAIEKGQAFLYSKQGKDGTWEEAPKPELSTEKDVKVTDLKARQWGGLTSIATLALLASGQSPKEPKLKPAIDFLQKANIQSTYGLGLSAQVWLLVPASNETRATMSRDAKMLELGMVRKGPGAGFYAYWTGVKRGTDIPHWSDNMLGFVPQPQGHYDLSNSQFAVLGMWALAEAGAQVPTDYWKRVEDAWVKAQQPDGGWKYNDSQEVKASITAAGVATLFITQDFTLPGRWATCHGGAPSKSLEAGLDWIDKNMEAILAEGSGYTLYGIERIGVASGRKYFGAVDWYQRGADLLVQHQGQDGSWGDIPNTSFVLLFLSRGRAPVMMNKLEYQTSKARPGVSLVWDERPRDAANLARWAGRQLERDLNWQTVTLKAAPEELHDAPILYISGSQELDFHPDEIDKLRTFVQQGGMVLGNSDCGQEAFTSSFKKLGSKLFPAYEFRPLPANHPIFTHEQYAAAKWRARPDVLGLSNGVRELMVLIPTADASRAWQTRSDRTKEEMFQLGSDLFLYSADKQNLLNKGETFLAAVDPSVTGTKKMRIARLHVGPNPDPEPGAWPQLTALMHNRFKTDLTLFDATPGTGDLVTARIAHLTGTTAFTLSSDARLELKAFVQNGGTLIVEAAGGSPEFATAAESELKSLFGPSAAQLDKLLSPNHPVYNQPDDKIETVGYRAYSRENGVGRAREPRLRGLTFGKKVRVFYSREDMVAGLVGQPVDGIYGYDPTSAANLMAAMILYAAGK